MFCCISVSLNSVLEGVESRGGADCTSGRDAVPAGLGYGLCSSTPPAKLSHVGKNDAGWVRQRLDVFDHINTAALVDTARATKCTLSQNTEILIVLIEKDDYAPEVGEAGGCEDRNMRLCGGNSKWEQGSVEVEGGEAPNDFLADAGIHGFALHDVDAVILTDEELKVVVWVIDRTDLITRGVNEVAAECEYIQKSEMSSTYPSSARL